VDSIRTGNWLRKGVALAATYLFALQIILAGIAATQMASVASGTGQTICHSIAGDPDQPPQPVGPPSYDGVCGLCIYVTASAAIPAGPSFKLPRLNLVAGPSLVAAAELDIGRDRQEPRSSQGPPARS
jgi:hypothetical protein